MTTNLTAANGACAFDWVDITDPSEDELTGIASQYGLHSSSVSDCLQPGHLPKYEEFADYTFIIFRICFTQPDEEADTVQELTSKIAVFISDKFIITIHRKPWQHIATISNEYVQSGRCANPYHVLNIIVRTGLHSFDEPGTMLTQSIEFYEKQVFLTTRKVSLLKGLYFLKRKLDVIRRLLLLTHEIIDRMDTPEATNAYTRDIRDLYIKQRSLYDSLYENVNHLVSLYFNISAQRTNETMRVLTVFSVFFMPLTFIAGVYGMNFKFMPELNARYGYPIAMAVMAVVVIVIFAWFRRKKWL